MNSKKSYFQMYREMVFLGPVLLVAVRKNGVLTGDWQGRWYASLAGLDKNAPSLVVEAPTAEVAVEKLHEGVMAHGRKLLAGVKERAVTEAEQAADGLRQMMKEDKLDL